MEIPYFADIEEKHLKVNGRTGKRFWPNRAESPLEAKNSTKYSFHLTPGGGLSISSLNQTSGKIP